MLQPFCFCYAVAAQEKRRRMKLEASQARMLKRMEEAVKRYDECFVLLAKDVRNYTN